MTAVEVIDGKISSESSKRTRRQLLGCRKWSLNEFAGTIEWPTGVGKTRSATEAIQLLRRNDPNRTVVVVVPKISLKNQWEKGLLELGLMENTEVVVINSLVKRKTVTECDMLILDEIHRYAAETFSKVFQKVKYHFILGLTATLKRIDGKHDILSKYCPIIDKMSLYEAKKEGYIAQFREYNLGIELTAEEAELYRGFAATYGYNLDKFNGNFELMLECSYGLEPKIFRNASGSEAILEPRVVKRAVSLGWRGNTPFQAFKQLQINKVAARGQRQDIWGNTGHQFSPKRLYVNALQGMRAIRKMKEFISLSPGKRLAAVELTKLFNRKTIIFGERIAQAQLILQGIGEKAVIYHSEMTAREKNEALRKLFAEDDEVNTVITAKSLDEGFDWPEAELGIIESRTSSQTQQTQRRGRVVRLHVFTDGTDKRGIIINIYLIGTKDEEWLRKSLRGTPLSRWVTSIDEILAGEGLPFRVVLNEPYYAGLGRSTEILREE